MIYLYCLTDASSEDLNFLSRELYTFVPFGKLTIVSSRWYDKELFANSNIMEHCDINNRIMKQGFTVLPFAYGTIIPEGEVLSSLKIDEEAVMLAIATFRDKVEMGMKVLFPAEKDTFYVGLQNRLGDTPGHRYISGKVDNYAPYLTGLVNLNCFRRDVEKRFTPICCDLKFRVHSSHTTLVNIAFLVERENTDLFFNTAQDLKNTFTQCKYLISGPWPAYNFINLNNNIKRCEGDSKWIT